MEAIEQKKVNGGEGEPKQFGPRKPTPEPEPKKPSMGSDYSLSEQEMVQARRLHSQIVIAKAQYAEFMSRVDQLERELEQAVTQRDAQKSAVDGVIMKSTGWADAIALSRGDDEPTGFQVDFQNGMTRIVRVQNANMG